jgi:hypothetical protein
MCDWIKDKIKGYYDWLFDNTSINLDQSSGWYAIQTPFVGLMNDCIEVYIKKEGDRILLSDDGDTLFNLGVCGVSRSSKFTSILQRIENIYGVKVVDNELQIVANDSDFNLKKHALIGAIQQLSDLPTAEKKSVPGLLADDVQKYFDRSNLIYTREFVIKGKSLYFNYDFQIAGRKEEMVIRTFNSLNQGTTTSLLFGIEEIRNLRQNQSGKDLKSVVIVNRHPADDIVSALNDYDSKLLIWEEQGRKWDAKAFEVA